MIKKIARALLLVVALVILIDIFYIIFFNGSNNKKNDTVIGFVMPGSSEDIGWNGMNYRGIVEACNTFQVKLVVKENVSEEAGKCQKEIKQLIEEGAELIILSSYSYAKDVEAVAKEYPDISFSVCSCYDSQNENVSGYFIRMYQARYLAGILAGLHTKSNEIGYVAAIDTDEVIRGINAFTLGAQSVNPNVKVIVSFTGGWDDEEKERQATRELLKNTQIDFVTCHQNSTYVVEEAEAAGIESIGYHEKTEGFSEKYLTAVCGNWKLAYEEIIRAFLQKKTMNNNLYWLGIEKNVVELAPYSSLVTNEDHNEIQKARQDFLNGKDVFMDEIRDKEGTVRCKEGERISDEMLMSQMNWFVEGVEIYEK